MLQFLNSPITIDEIQKAIRKLKCKKAAGIDGIPAEFYKHGSNELLPALVLLFNTIIANGEYPSSWATGIIHPVHKKAAHNVPDNYRKVIVMPCIVFCLLKMMYAVIMIPFKPALEVTPGRLIIFLYYVPLEISKGVFQSPCINVLLILQKHLTMLSDQHCTINY